mgnify:CR=1 FL=1
MFMFKQLIFLSFYLFYFFVKQTFLCKQRDVERMNEGAGDEQKKVLKIHSLDGNYIAKYELRTFLSATKKNSMWTRGKR